MSNVISYATYLKSNPKKFYRTDSTFGTRSTIEPTLIGNGFTVHTFEYNDWDKTNKPKKIVLEYLDEMEFTQAVYSTFKARDFHTAFIYIAFKI